MPTLLDQDPTTKPLLAASSPSARVFPKTAVCVTSLSIPRQQAERRVEIDRNTTQPTGELAGHDPGGDTDGVDGAARGVTAVSRVGLWKQRVGVLGDSFASRNRFLLR